MDEEEVVDIYNGILLSYKNYRDLAICDNRVGPRGSYAK